MIIKISDRDFIIDDEDAELTSLYKWSCKRSGPDVYALGYLRSRGGYKERIRLHRLIMGLKNNDNRVVDHKNNNKLDNRKSNLRICTRKENRANMSRRTHYVGVYPHRRKFIAKVVCNRVMHYLGLFEDPKEAAAAYDAKARELFGEFAYQNLKQ